MTSPDDHPISKALHDGVSTFIDVESHAVGAAWIDGDPGSAVGLRPRSLITVSQVG